MRIALGLALLSAACIYACGSSSSSPNGGSAGTEIGAAGDSSSTGGKGNGGAGKGNAGSDAGATGDSGAGGQSDVPVVVVVSDAKPHAAGGLVAGSTVAHSKHFTGVFSLGAAPGGNRISTSTKYQLRGGVLGASQK